MRDKVFGKKLAIRWGTSSGDFIGSIDVIKEYTSRGGTVAPETSVEFSSTFPPETYKKTALTDYMRDSYECAGSISVAFYHPNGRVDYVSISDYFDLTGHNPGLGDHHNLYLQWQIGNEEKHTDEISSRHIPLAEKLCLAGCINDKTVYEDIVRANL